MPKSAKNVTVGQVPGSPANYNLDDCKSTVADALAAAGIDSKGVTVTVNNRDAKLSDALEAGDSVLVFEALEGNVKGAQIGAISVSA